MVPIFNGEPVVAAWPNKTLGKIPKPGPKAIIARVAQKTRRVQVKTLRCFITGFLSILVDTSASCHRCLREAALFTWPELVKLMSPPLLAQAAPAFALATGIQQPPDGDGHSHDRDPGHGQTQKAQSRKEPRAHLIPRCIDSRIDEALCVILIFQLHKRDQDLPTRTDA